MTALAAAGFRGAGTRMQPGDLVAVAQLGGYEVATLQAVMDVEAGGSGFDAAGRPKLLDERHVFYRELGPGAKRSAAVRDGLAYLTWGTLHYPANSDGNYALLARMMAVDPVAALRSCSWGIGQVMGLNFAACGFATVQDMVAACMDGEKAQFTCMLRYIEHAGLGAALKRHDWVTFATGYNGPGAVEAYAGRLAAAYARRCGSAVARSVPLASIVQVPSASDTLNDAEWLKIRAGQA